jgi:hypothetical protein
MARCGAGQYSFSWGSRRLGPIRYAARARPCAMRPSRRGRAIAGRGAAGGLCRPGNAASRTGPDLGSLSRFNPFHHRQLARQTRCAGRQASSTRGQAQGRGRAHSRRHRSDHRPSQPGPVSRGRTALCWSDDTMRNGRACGGRSAHSRPGGAAPLCYPIDVTAFSTIPLGGALKIKFTSCCEARRRPPARCRIEPSPSRRQRLMNFRPI